MKYMIVFLQLSRTEVKTFGSVMEVKPVYNQHSSGDIMKYVQTEFLGFFMLFYALPFNENEKDDKNAKVLCGLKFIVFV